MKWGKERSFIIIHAMWSGPDGSAAACLCCSVVTPLVGVSTFTIFKPCRIEMFGILFLAAF